MPKVRVETHPIPEDYLHLIRLKIPKRCSNPNCQKLSDHPRLSGWILNGQDAWWDHRDKTLYCLECKAWRVSEEGVAWAVMRALSVLGR